MKWCAGCARGIEYVWKRTLPCAPLETRVLSATPNNCTQPTPAVTKPRGVEDAAPYGREENHGIRIVVDRCVNAANLCPSLGSPERGAVTARSGVTEGLVQGRCGHTSVIRQPRPGGRGSPPLRGVGRWVREIQRRPSTGVRRAWRRGGAWNRRRRSTDGGAPGTAHPTARGERFRIVITSSVNQRKGRRGRRPLRGVR